MAEPSTHINYSFEDIQRYLQGKMSSAEMHAIEKAALQDPFLADAIEGFNDADLATAQQHLNDINTFLRKEKQETKVVAFNKKTQWLNVAALLIILAGVGVVASYFLRSSNQQTQVAQVKKDAAGNSVLKDSITVSANTSAKNADTALLIAQNKTSKKVAPATAKKNSIKKDAASALKEDKTVTATMAAAPAVQNEMAARSFATADSQAILQGKVSGLSVLPKTFSGKVIDENNKPVAGAYIQSADKKDATITDINGNFSIQKADTVMNVTTSTVGYYSANTKLEPGTNKQIVLRGSNPGLNEVVVVGYGAARKRKTADSSMPVGGWNNFSNYVLNELKKDSAEQSITNADDLVEMEFLIDKLGNPYNIKITKSLDERRNEKAIEILKNGPRWTSTSRKKTAKVAISFKTK